MISAGAAADLLGTHCIRGNLKDLDMGSNFIGGDGMKSFVKAMDVLSIRSL